MESRRLQQRRGNLAKVPFLMSTHRSAIAAAWRRMFHLLGSIGLGWSAATVPVTATSAELQVPQHWLSYAQLVSKQFQTWLGDSNDETVQRLHTFMQDRLLQGEASRPPAPLVVRVWIAPNGQVERLDFASLGNAQADSDLRSVLSSHSLSEAPPVDMRQPMVLQLDLTFVTPV